MGEIHIFDLIKSVSQRLIFLITLLMGHEPAFLFEVKNQEPGGASIGP
jgi:hypothetical protein